MYKVEKTRISLIRGDSLILHIGIKENGEDYEVQPNDTIKFFLRNSELKKDKTEYVVSGPLVTKTIDNVELKLQIDPIDTIKLPFGRYTYEVQLTTEDGIVDTFISDILDLIPNAAPLMANGVFTPTENKIMGKLSIFDKEEES